MQRFAFWRAVVFLLPFICFTACKDDSLLGLEVQPEGSLDGVVKVDSFTIRARTIESDPQRSSQYRAFVGRLENDAFGVSESMLFLNFRLESENIALDLDPSEYAIDSIVLRLYPREVYGNGGDPVTIEAYPLDERMYLDSTYRSSVDFRIDDDPVGETSVQIASNDAIEELLSDSAYQGVRWKLDNGLGAFLLNGLGIEYYDSEQFLNYFYGLALKVKDGSAPEGGVMYDFAISSGQTGIILYYHPKNDPSAQEELIFEMASNTSRVNRFEHDYSSGLVSSYLASPSNDEDLLFVQGMAGVKARIEIPYLNNFALSTDAAINQATISFKVAPEQPDYINPSGQLYLLDYEIDPETGETIETLNLDYIFSTNRHGGRYDSESGSYTFDVTRQVQEIIEASQRGEDINLGWTLNAQVPVLNDNQVRQNVIMGSDNIVLKLYYTDISN